MSSTIETTKKKNPFTFNKEFKREFDCVMKVYDETFNEFHKVTSSTTVDVPDEYGVCNNNYKLRFITPTNISSFISYIMKALKNQLIKPNIGDMEKFAVATAKQFIADNGCVPVEDSSIYATGDYSSDHMTLQDLLLLCENDVYHTSVCSKYDMAQRRASMKDDVSKIVDMHYGANMKKIVNALPTLFDKTDFGDMEYSERELITTYVETFILFATTLNCITMSNMILYCVPKSTYNTHAIEKKENDIKYNSLVNGDYYNESVDTSQYKPIFVILMSGHRVYSALIKARTLFKFSHSAICFDTKLKDAYTFDGGFTMDHIQAEKFDEVPAEIFAVYVSNEHYKIMKDFVKDFEDHQDDTKYSRTDIAKMLFGIDKTGKDKYAKVCSTFVDAVFKAASVNITGKNLPTPGYFDRKLRVDIAKCCKVYEGNLGKSIADLDISNKLDEFAKSEKSQPIDSVVTECCLLKTNNMMLRNKIPFNINMRDIVLQDMHPNFKDTKSALHFILKDSRSPISQLLIKYGDEKKCHYMDPMVVINLFAHDTRCRFDCDRDFLACQYERTDFHTDVNWLDKIAYGNNYLNGNYRNDGVGNHNFNSMTTTLDTLYRMFGDCALNSSEELANHIMVIADLMNTVIRAYSECHIKNWDLVRDVLAVLGEIITRCMIKLYNNHMTVFVATDNMNNVDIPGYLYTESFVMEADDAKPTVVNNSGATGVKAAVQKAQTVATQMLHKFIAWIQSVLSKVPVKFLANHQAEINWIKNSDKNGLNKNISDALANGSFKPTITNFPDYHIPARELTSNKISDIVNKYLNMDNNAQITVDTIKYEFYPEKVRNALNLKATPVQESYVVEADQNKQTVNSKENQILSNYFLYGDPNHQPSGSNNVTQLKPEQWKMLHDDLIGTAPLLEKEVKALTDDLNKACTDVEKRIKEANSKLESFKNNNNVDNDEKNKVISEKNRCETLANALRDITNAYHTTFLNVLQSKFYATSYTLYRDIVTAYNQQKSVNQTNETPQTESFVNAIDGIDEIIV